MSDRGTESYRSLSDTTKGGNCLCDECKAHGNTGTYEQNHGAKLLDVPGGGHLLPGDAIQAILDRITYKDGWTFWVVSHPGPRQWLWAKSPVIDSRDGHQRDEFHRAVPIDWPNDFQPTEATVIAFVRRAIEQWEVHEANEFLRLDGQIIHDPHQCPQCVIGGCRA